MMEIYRDPIQPNPQQTISIQSVYRELNAVLESLTAEKDTAQMKELAQQCVSFCRTAIGTFAWDHDYESILKVVNFFNRYSQIIVNAGNFTSTDEFNILIYGHELEGQEEVQKEKERLKKDFLSKLCAKPSNELSEIQYNKHKKVAFFQGLSDVSHYYHKHYGK